MCGLAGVVSFSQACRVDPAHVAGLAGCLSDEIAHRGPDGAGVFSLGLSQGDPLPTPDRPQALLIHRRLAVIDPAPRSDQPFCSPDERLVLLFNGEIYNYRELRTRLSPRDWRTTSDTEVLLAAYEAWGEGCVEHLEGMFAFAVFDWRDPTEPKLFLARDPAGQKPLFVSVRRDGGQTLGVAFASELAAIRRVPWVDREIDPLAIQEYLAWGYIPGKRSVHQGIIKLLPGHAQLVTPRSVVNRRYFDAGGRHELHGDDRWASAVTLTRQLVGAAVRKRLVADVPIGSLLSGGIDSSVITLCMARALREEGRTVDTFSIGFDDPRYDESAYAEEVARHLGTRHHAFHVTPTVVEDLPKLAHVFGEPFADSSAIPTHYLSRQTRRHVTVALGGDGGDELFGGYDRYRALRLTQRLERIPRPLRELAAAVARRMGYGHPKSTAARARRLAESLPLSPGARYATYMRLFSHSQLVLMLPGGTVAREEPGKIGDRWFEAYLRGRDVVAAATALDRVTYLPGDLLVKLDRCSMLHALEVRSPFMDADLLRFAGTLGEAGLLDTRGGKAGGKRLLRDAFAMDLPESVFRRRKMGFAVPVGDWFRGKLRPMLQETLLARDGWLSTHVEMGFVHRLLDAHLTNRANHDQRLYALLMLELWWRDLKSSAF